MALPKAYTRLEFIKSTGSQYIDTGFKPNQDTRVVLNFENTGDYSSMATELCPLFGARNASSAASAAAFAMWVGTKSYPHYGNAAYSANGNFTIDINAILTYEMNKNVVSIGNDVITCSSASFTTNYNLCLLTINNYGTIETRRASGKLWSAKIYDNGTLVRDFVPCKNSSNVVGLYDLVNGVFYTDAAGGTFTAGAELIPSHKIVDSTLLDVAITATADAIRVKSGKSDDIPWGETSGFASAISAISGGKVASGSITPSSTSSTLTVSGIGFTPKRIVLYLAPTDNYITFNHKTVLYVEGGERKYCFVMGDGASSYFFNRTSNLTVTMNDDGFTVNTGLTTAQFFYYRYNYLAIG